jgi:hypothetical protein
MATPLLCLCLPSTGDKLPTQIFVATQQSANLGDTLALLEAFGDVWGRGRTAGNEDDNGDGDGDMGGGHDNNGNRTGTPMQGAAMMTTLTRREQRRRNGHDNDFGRMRTTMTTSRRRDWAVLGLLSSAHGAPKWGRLQRRYKTGQPRQRGGQPRDDGAGGGHDNIVGGTRMMTPTSAQLGGAGTPLFRPRRPEATTTSLVARDRPTTATQEVATTTTAAGQGQRHGGWP